MAKVKFIRLGHNVAVDVSKYDSYKQSGSIIFAKVNAGAGTWQEDTSTYVEPSYYIWANGIEYHVADASALAYALQRAELANQDISVLKGDDTVEGSIQKAIKDALDAYRPKAEHIAQLVDAENSNVTVTAVNSSLTVNCEEAATTGDVTAAIKVGYLDKNTNIPAGTNIQTLVDMIFNPDLGVEPVKPTAGISNASTAAGNYEIGTAVNVNLSASYTDGYFKAVDNWGANQNANCIADMSGVTYKRGSVVLAGNTDTYTLTAEGTAVSYSLTVPYGKSQNVPVSKKGNILSDVSIAAGTATSGAVKFTGYYRYYYIVNGTNKLTASSTWNDCVTACTNNGLLTGNVTVLDATGVQIGTPTELKYVYVLIPNGKATPTYQNSFGAESTMAVINDALVNPLNNVTYKLLAIDVNGIAGVVYKNLVIKK